MPPQYVLDDMSPELLQLVIFESATEPQMPPQYVVDEIILIELLQLANGEEVEIPQIPPVHEIDNAKVLVTCPALVRFWKLPFFAYPKIPTYCNVVVRYNVMVWLSPSKWPLK